MTAGLVVVALWLGYGLIGISAATCIVSLVDYVLRWRVSRWLAPRLSVSFNMATVARLREIAAFGAWNFLISINTYVYQYVPSLLIGTLMPIAAVGYFALAASLSRQVNSVLAPIGQVIYPAAVDLHVQGDRDRLERLYHDGSRLTMLAMIPVVLLGMFWAQDFYRLWVGPGYVENSPYGSVAVIFQILLLSTFTSFSNIAGQILMGAGQIRLVAIALVSGSVLALSLSLGLVEKHGLFGVAVAFVIASVLVDLLALPLLLQRVLGLSVTGFLRRACLRPVTVAVAQVVLILGVKSIGSVKDWMDLILQGLLAGSSCLVVVMFIGITAEERQRLLLQPIRSLFRKMFSDLRVWRGVRRS